MKFNAILTLPEKTPANNYRITDDRMLTNKEVETAAEKGLQVRYVDMSADGSENDVVCAMNKWGHAGNNEYIMGDTGSKVILGGDDWDDLSECHNYSEEVPYMAFHAVPGVDYSYEYDMPCRFCRKRDENGNWPMHCPDDECCGNKKIPVISASWGHGTMTGREAEIIAKAKGLHPELINIVHFSGDGRLAIAYDMGIVAEEER